MNNLPWLSASKISTFVGCKSSYIAKYLLRMKPAVETTWAIFGSAVHEAIEAAYHDQFPYTVADTVIERRFAELENIPHIGYTPAQVRTKTYAILDAFDYSRYTPKHMEYEFILPFYDMCMMHGFIDLITDDGRVIDYKTNSKAPTQKEVNNSIQLAIYLWAYGQITGQDPTQVAIHHLPTDRLIVADKDMLSEKLAEIITFYVPEILELTADTPIEVCKSCSPFCALKRWE